MDFIINDGSDSNYPENSTWNESNEKIINKWLKEMNIEKLPLNYKLFSKIEKSMTKATRIITNLYGHPSGNYFETAQEAKIHMLYLLGKTKVCQCIHCKQANTIYVKSKKRKYENGIIKNDESDDLFMDKKKSIKKAWLHLKTRKTDLKVDNEAIEWSWYNGYRENEIVWAPLIEENNGKHSIFWAFQIVKRLSSLEISDILTFENLINYEKVINFVSNVIIKPSSSVNLKSILNSVTNEIENSVNLDESQESDNCNASQTKDTNDKTLCKEKCSGKEKESSNNDFSSKKSLMSLLSNDFDEDDENDEDFVLSEDDDCYTDTSDEHIKRPQSDSGSEFSVGSVLNDTQNNSLQQIESLGYICRRLPLSSLSLEQTAEKLPVNYYFIPFKIIIPFLMYDPCSKNNILWNRATMQALDLSSSYSIPRVDRPISPSHWEVELTKSIPLEYFRFGTEQIYQGDLLRLDLESNTSTCWIKTINGYERVDKHEYFEIIKINEIRNKSKSIIELVGSIYFSVFSEKSTLEEPEQTTPVSPSESPTNSSSSIMATSSKSLASTTPLSSSSSYSSLSTFFIPEQSDILWIKSDEIRTIQIDQVCGRYYVNCPTLERKMRISSEKEWNKDTSIFGSKIEKKKPNFFI